MRAWKAFLLALVLVAVIGAICIAILIRRGFRASAEPSAIETVVARTVRDLAIPDRARDEKNPLSGTSQELQQGREDFIARCGSCHGQDGTGSTQIGRNLYPRVPNLRSPQTQSLTDGEIHFIIQNGVELTGMPAWGKPHQEEGGDSWKLVLFIRSLRPLTNEEKTQQVQTTTSAKFVGSQACQKCHAEIYEGWKKTPMANVVRDPREHPDAISEVHSGPSCLRLRKPLEAALLYENRRRLFSAAGPVGGRQPQME